MRAHRQDYVGARSLRASDFEELAGTGLWRMLAPTEFGGSWRSLAESARPVAESYRALARGDSSVALVASMHASVLGFWLCTPDVDATHATAWAEQRRRIFTGVVEDDHQWGTISSEPGSGGDHSRISSTAQPDGAAWRLSGIKHFGSGSGITSWMLTTAVAEGEDITDWFFTDALTGPWDGTAGVHLIREWDGRGMTATQSHAFRFEDVPAERIAWPGHQADLIHNAAGFGPTIFTAVILGVVEEALSEAAERLSDRPPPGGMARDWHDAQLDGWTLRQVYEGMVRSLEGDQDPAEPVTGKLAAARLAESAMLSLTRVIGGSSLSASNPFGQWFEDVRALGFLRPPWGLMYDSLD